MEIMVSTLHVFIQLVAACEKKTTSEWKNYNLKIFLN